MPTRTLRHFVVATYGYCPISTQILTVLRELVCVGDRREWNISTAASPTLTGVRPRGFNPDMGTWLGIHTRSGLRRHRRHLIIGPVEATNPLETEERHLRSQRWPRRFGVTIIDLTKSNKTDHKSTNQLPQIYKSTTQIYKSLNLEATNTPTLTWSITQQRGREGANPHRRRRDGG